MTPLTIGIDLATRPDSGVLGAKCPKCGRVWIVAELPAPILNVADLAAKAVCPRCGHTSPLVASKEDLA